MEGPNARLEQFQDQYKTASHQALQNLEDQLEAMNIPYIVCFSTGVNFQNLHFLIKLEAFKKQMAQSLDFLKNQMVEFENVIKVEKESLKNEMLNLKKEIEKVSQSQFMLGDGITLNVSGLTEGLTIPRNLLTLCEGTSLEAMFSGRHEIKTIDGNPYLNRDPEIFKLLLSYLRGNKLDLEIQNPLQQQLFDEELKYWDLFDISTKLDKKLIEMLQSDPVIDPNWA